MQTPAQINPDPTRCSFYLDRKKRFCKAERIRIPASNSSEATAATAGSSSAAADASFASIYCHMHEQELSSGYSRATANRKGLLANGLVQASGTQQGIPSDTATAGEPSSSVANATTPTATSSGKGPRVPCPINPNHSVYEKDVAKHVKVCPDLRHDASTLPYFAADLHFRNRTTKGVFPSMDLPVQVLGEQPPSRTSCQDMDASNTTKVSNTAHKRLATEDLESLIRRVTSFYQTHVEHRIEKLIDDADQADQSVAEDSCEQTLASSNAQEIRSRVVVLEQRLKVGGQSAAASTSHNLSEEHVLTELISKKRLLRKLELSQQRLPSRKHGEQHDQLCAMIESSILVQRAVGPSVSAAENNASEEKKQPLWCVELGAGKAGLGQALHAFTVEGNQDANSLTANGTTLTPTVPFNIKGFIVADYGSFRHKADGKAKEAAEEGSEGAAASINSISFLRARINVKDFDLFSCLYGFSKDINMGKVGGKRARSPVPELGERPALGPSPEDFFVIGKHLCGACTDFSVSSCFYGPQAEPQKYSHVPNRCQGIAIATCCHHRCELKHFNFCESNSKALTPVGSNPQAAATSSPSFFSFADEEAEAIISLTSWAVSGKAVSPEQQRVGWVCKRIIDFHRLLFIEDILRQESRLAEEEEAPAPDCGTDAVAAVPVGNLKRNTIGRAWLAGMAADKTLKFRVTLLQYVDSDITPENVALVMEPVL